MSPASTVASTRWCPTPEQLMILEEMYRGGIRTPNATQIQQITAHLSLYGKIEGKNVFYWFQNHKARDRQKLRRRLTKQLMIQHQYQQQHQQLYPQQIDYFQQPNSSHILHFLEPAACCPHPPPPPPPPLGLHQQVPHYNSPAFLPQVQNTCCGPQMIDCAWKVEIADKEGEEKPVSRSEGDDWVIITDVGPKSSWCSTSTRPLKTLELFPIRSSCSSPKEESPAAAHLFTPPPTINL